MRYILGKSAVDAYMRPSASPTRLPGDQQPVGFVVVNSSGDSGTVSGS